MGMHTHLSILKEYGGRKFVFVDGYGFIETQLYQEVLVNEKLPYISLDEIPKEIFDEEYEEVEGLWLDEYMSGDGSICVIDMINMLKRFQKFYDEKSENNFFKNDWTELISKLDKMIKSNIVTENETIEFKYW